MFTSDPSLSEQLKSWTSALLASSDTARLDVEVLFKFVTGYTDVDLITRAQQPLNNAMIKQMEKLLEGRLKGEPIAYLVGQREFYGLPLQVNSHVLIPRPETELLVDVALTLIKRLKLNTFLDLGTGSGAIALAIASQASQTKGLAVDQSIESLELAQQNAKHLKIENVRFKLSNWYDALQSEQFDLIVSNPPYIKPDDEHLSQGDVRFEPKQALTSAENGLADLSHIVRVAPDYLSSGGHLIVEHGYDQGELVRTLLKNNGFEAVKTQQDLAQLDRISFGKKV